MLFIDDVSRCSHDFPIQTSIDRGFPMNFPMTFPMETPAPRRPAAGGRPSGPPSPPGGLERGGDTQELDGLSHFSVDENWGYPYDLGNHHIYIYAYIYIYAPLYTMICSPKKQLDLVSDQICVRVYM